MTLHFTILTAGHVDHGKSSLVKALTGTDPDRLPEEKARGITLDLGFAHLRLATAHDPTTTLDIGVIDAPGHENLVKNMVAGAGSVDLALLVVAADDGWMPQTEEHLQILTYLGVPALVVLTKCDLPGLDLDGTIQDIRGKMLDSPFATAPIVATSVVNGLGLDELQRALADVLRSAPPVRDIGKPRLPIDRVFTLPGIGTVVTGTLRGGCVHRGEEVVIQPLGGTARIRAIQSHKRELECASPGMRTALNLADLLPPTKSGAPGLQRGQVVTLQDLGRASDRCEVLLERSPRLYGDKRVAARPLRDRTRIRFHAGSGNTAGRIFLAERHELATADQCLAQIRFEAPVFTFMGDRFVIRDWAEQRTLAGGVVVDPCVPRGPARGSGEPTVAYTNASVAAERQLRRHRMVRRQALLAQSNFSPAEVEQALAQLSNEGKVLLVNDFALESKAWSELLALARTKIDAHHEAQPAQTGLPLAQLRAALDRELPAPETFELIVAELLRTGFQQAGPLIKRAAHQPALPLPLQAAGVNIRKVLSLSILEPPSRKDLAPDRASQEALRFLLQTGEAVELSPEIVLSSAAFVLAMERVRSFLNQHGSATVSELRQAVGASRRIVVPLLEKLDREGITQRAGDRRFLKAPGATSR